jgi:hypothetical protein
MTWTEYLKSARTMTEEEVAHRTAEHDAHEFALHPVEQVVAAPRKDHTTVLSG